MMNVLQIQVSCFENFSTTNKPISTTIGKLLDCIRSGGKKGSQSIYQIRCAKDDATRKSLKRNLPMAMWQGVFSNRSNNGLQSLSSVMCVDIDHIPQALDGLKLQLQNEPWVLAFFTSPSGDGTKGACEDRLLLPGILHSMLPTTGRSIYATLWHQSGSCRCYSWTSLLHEL